MLRGFLIFRSMFTISLYKPIFKQMWDEFVAVSRNATFILNRDYMDYHADRFTDASLIIRNDKEEIISLFAASAHDKEICAHGGLTYGGMMLPYDILASTVLEIFDRIIEHYQHLGYNSMIYKPVPHIYHRYPCEEDIYALFRHNGILAECNLSTVIPLDNPIPFNTNSRRNLAKGEKAGIVIKESNDFANFWKILVDMLRTRHNAVPVHTLDEIVQLKAAFPESIKLYMAEENSVPVAGVVIYLSDKVAHCQYIASSQRGFDTGALSLLFYYLIDEFANNTHLEYFDFGTSNENHGLILNDGLIRQKYGFGGRGVVYPIYRIAL